MKRIFLLIVFILSFMLSACTYEYEGKNIDTISYITVNYMGGFKRETIVDLTNGSVKYREYLEEDKDTTDFILAYEFDITKVEEFLNEAGKSGLFDLEDEYITNDILDGGEWNISILFEDGSIKESKGINNYPDIFKDSDYAFFKLYGDDLFNTIPNYYKNPPVIYYTIKFTQGSTTTSNGSGLIPIEYTWHGIEVVVDNPFVTVVNPLNHSFDTSIEYKLVLWTANYNIKFTEMILTSYNLDGTEKNVIDETNFFSQKEYTLELDRIYVITMTFENGTCNYYLSTENNE